MVRKSIVIDEEIFYELMLLKKVFLGGSWNKFFREIVIPTMRNKGVKHIYDFWLPIIHVLDKDTKDIALMPRELTKERRYESYHPATED